MKFSSRRSLVSRWHLWRSCPVSIFHILWISMLTRCHARDVVICTTSETFGYAAQSDLFDFEEHKLRMAWFDTVDLIPLPDTGGCDIVRLPSYMVISYISRGVDLQMHTLRFQLRDYFQLVAYPHIISPHMLLGKSVAVPNTNEMRVFLLHAVTIFTLTYREISMQELLEGGVVPSEDSMTVVLCDEVAQVDLLYTTKMVDAKVMRRGGSTLDNDSNKVVFTSEDIRRWGHPFSYLVVTTRQWVQDQTNLRILQYFAAVTEVHDAHYALQPFSGSSPELLYLAKMWLGLLGNNVVGGEIQGVPRRAQADIAAYLAVHMHTYISMPSGENFWERHMSYMMDKTIVSELVANSELFFVNDWSRRKMDAAEFDNHLDLRAYEGFVAVVMNVLESHNWTLGQTPGVQRPAPPLGAWDNWPTTEQALYCSGEVELSADTSGNFSDGHLGRGQYAPNSECDWTFPESPVAGITLPPPPLLIEFPLLFLEPLSEKDTVQVVDPRAPHRLLAHFRGEVVGGAVRHAGPLTVKFRSNRIQRLNTMELEMGLNAVYSRLGCDEDPRGCGEGTCGDDGVCVCPEGRSGVDCSSERCLGTNVHTLQPGGSAALRSNGAPFYLPLADCRWEVHPPGNCAACVVDVVFTSLETELGQDAVQVAVAPSAAAFWWEHPPNGTVVYSRSDLNASGLRVRGTPGMAVFVRLHSDEVVEAAGFEATARVLDPAQAPGGASTSNCYDAEGGQPCSGRGECVPGMAEGELGQCACEAGFFGRTCRDGVCDLANVAPTLPTWSLSHTNGKHWIARNSVCQWVVAPAPLYGNGGTTLRASSVRASVREWDFEGTRNNRLALSADPYEVTLQTNRCPSGQECDLHAQCSRREGSAAGPCQWMSTEDTLEMPPEFTLTLQTGINALHPHVTLVFQATFVTASGYLVVAKLEDPKVLVCMLEQGKEHAELVFDYDILECSPPKSEEAPTLPDNADSEDNSIYAIVLVPILVFLFVLAIALVYRNCSLSYHLTDLRSRSMRMDPEAPAIDLDSPLTKVTKYLGKISEKRPFILRWLFPKNDLARQAEALQTMLLESENVHRPRLDTNQLQAEYGQDIVDFLLVSTCAHRYPASNDLVDLVVDPNRAASATSAQNPESGSSLDRNLSCTSLPSDPSNKMTEEETVLLANAGISYDVDLSRVYTLKRKGALCFVGLKVMDEWDLIRSLKISRSKMTSYLLAVEDGYLDNPYHNVYHAADVTSRVATMFTRSGLAEHLRDTRNGRIQLLGVVLAAAVHDYGHPGTNNAYAVNTGQLYAKIYNDQAVYENSALYQVLCLVDKHELDFAVRCCRDTKRLLRLTIIDLVLSTDMSRHFDIVTMVKSKVASAVQKAASTQSTGFLESLPKGITSRGEAEAYLERKPGIDLQELSTEQMHLIFQFALKVADIGHCMLPLDQHKFWVGNLENEFFNQGDLELQAGLSISPLMDRTKPGPTNGSNQAGFFEVIVMPTISLWVTLFPGSADVLHKQTMSNLKYWRTSGRLDPARDHLDLISRHQSYDADTVNQPDNSKSKTGDFTYRHTLDSVDLSTKTCHTAAELTQRSVTAAGDEEFTRSLENGENGWTKVLSFKNLEGSSSKGN